MCHISSIAQPLLIAHPENATIEKLYQVSRAGSNKTAMAGQTR